MKTRLYIYSPFLSSFYSSIANHQKIKIIENAINKKHTRYRRHIAIGSQWKMITLYAVVAVGY